MTQQEKSAIGIKISSHPTTNNASITKQPYYKSLFNSKSLHDCSISI